MVVSDSKEKKQSTIVNEEKSADVITYVTLNSQASSKQISTESGVSSMSVIRILHNHKFHLYHFLYIQIYTKWLCKLC